jgi:hypothetical protein
MTNVRFVWDEGKARSNQRKHRISFDEATTVFADPLALIFDNEAHSRSEAREIIIGHSVLGRLLLVCFTERPGDVVRLINARHATRTERHDYEIHARR